MLECGQHDDSGAVCVAYRAIQQTLALLGLTSLAHRPLASEFQVLSLADVVHLEHDNDRFAQAWKSFDPVMAEEVIGLGHDGREVTAPADGFVVFPNRGALPSYE